MLHESKGHYFLLARDKSAGVWVLVSDSNSPSVFPDHKGSVIVEADKRTGYKRLCELADQLEGK